MKTAQEILAEIELKLEQWGKLYTKSTTKVVVQGAATALTVLMELKQFILNEPECEHEWKEVFTSFGWQDGCAKCGAVK